MADDKNWWKRKGSLMFRSEADRLHYDSLPETTPQENRSMGLLMKIAMEVREDEHNPDDYFTDDKGGEWHNDCPTNPYGENFHPDGEPFIPDAFIDDYETALIREVEDNSKAYALLNEYLHISFPYESDHIKTMTLVIFSKFMQIDFSDVLDLVAIHPTKTSTTGFSKLSKELQGVNKKILTDVIMDYIQMMKDAGMPSINEDHIIAMKDKGMTTLAEFWHIYGTMAHLVDGNNDRHFVISEMTNANANHSALKRFKEKITDDKNVLYPLLAYLYSQWANDEDWKEQTNNIQNAIPGSGGEQEYFNDLGYSGLMYAQDNLEHYRWKDNGYHLYKNRKEDWNEFKDSNFDSLDDFIKNKYFS